MPKFTLDNSFRFYSQKETTPNFHSESIERLLQKLSSADTLPLYAREGLIQADLMRWKEILVKINDVLDDSMKKQATNQSVNMWLVKLQNLAYDVEDLLDEFQTETFWRELMRGESTSQPSTSQQLNSRAMSRVKEVTARLQNISWEIALLGLKSRNVRRGLVPTSSQILAAIRLRGGRRDPIPGLTVFSPLLNEANLALLKNEDSLDLLEIIGSSSLGQVYKTELPRSNGKMIAIKKIVLPQLAAEFIEEDDKLLNRRMRIRHEITTACQIRHMNILPLLAHVAKPHSHLLVYGYRNNGTLQDILNDIAQGKRELDWPVRHRIALGIASGLEYLHFNPSPSIMHGDIKPANVFLDDDMTAKISTIDLAMAMPEIHIETWRDEAGSMVYRAPECVYSGKVTCKCDIYSFGVLLAVLVIGKLPSDEFFCQTEDMNLVRWMKNILASENPFRAIDSKILGNGYEKKMLLALKIACFCILDDPQERPTSKDLTLMLSEIQH